MIGERASAARRGVVKASAHGENEVACLHYGTSFQVQVLRRRDDSVILSLIGELDITSMAQFQGIISEVLWNDPRELIFDLTQCAFVSAQGYAAIGRCSLEVPVRVRSRTALASKVLTIYGYERVAIAIEREPDVSPQCRLGKRPCAGSARVEVP